MAKDQSGSQSPPRAGPQHRDRCPRRRGQDDPDGACALLHGCVPQSRLVLRALRGRPSSRIQGASARAAEQFVVAGSRKLRVEPPIDATRDWALVRLESPICKGGVLKVETFGAKRLDAASARGELTHVSFHHDFANWRLAHAGRCKIEAGKTSPRRDRLARDFSQPGALLLHACDTGGASSGSPLLVTKPGVQPKAIAINVGTYVQTRMLLEKGKVVRRFKSDAIANTAVSAAAFRSSIEILARADILNATNDIRALQTGLKALGLYHARVDGSFGPATRLAIQLYRGSRADPLNGIPTRELLSELSALPETNAKADGAAEKRTQTLSRGRLEKKIKPRRP